MACPRCNRLLTGSTSQGRSKKYEYYHGPSTCGFRIQAIKYHELLAQKLEGLIPEKRYEDQYAKIITGGLAIKLNKLTTKKSKVINSIEVLTDRIFKARNLLLDSHIGYEEYDNIKCDLESKIELLGKTVDMYSKMQMDLTDKIKSSFQHLPDPQKLLQALNDSNKSSLLNMIVRKSHAWNLEYLDEIFEMPFRMIYGLIDTNSNAIEVEENEIEAALQMIANLQLSLT